MGLVGRNEEALISPQRVGGSFRRPNALPLPRVNEVMNAELETAAVLEPEQQQGLASEDCRLILAESVL